MKKKSLFIPIVSLSSSGGDGSFTGEGSGEGADRPVACSYTTWLNSIWVEDCDGSPGIDEWDYAWWWESNEFSKEDWEELNPDLPWDEYFD